MISVNSENFNTILQKIELKIVRHDPLYLEFDIKNAPISFINAIRRILINEIPSIAVNKITIHENSSIMSDESLCHRIGLVPIVVCEDEYLRLERHLDLREVRVELIVKNNGNQILDVMSDDLKVVGKSRFINGVVMGILITQLAPGQEIRLEATLAVGTGKMHTKWSPVCPASYKYMPYVEKNPTKKDEMTGKEDMRNCKLTEIDGRKILRDENHVIFTIQSLVVDPLLLLKKSFRVLKERCCRLEGDVDVVLGGL